MKFYKKNLNFAVELGVPLTLQGLTSWTVAQESDEDKWKMYVRLCQKLSVEAKKYKTRLLLEPCNLYEIPLINKCSDYQRLVDDAQVDNIEILMDAFHLNIEELNPEESLKKYAKQNSIFHISNSNRGGIGFGHIDFQKWSEKLFRMDFQVQVF